MMRLCSPSARRGRKAVTAEHVTGPRWRARHGDRLARHRRRDTGGHGVAWEGALVGTIRRHVHLHVGGLKDAEAFEREAGDAVDEGRPLSHVTVTTAV